VENEEKIFLLSIELIFHCRDSPMYIYQH